MYTYYCKGISAVHGVYVRSAPRRLSKTRRTTTTAETSAPVVVTRYVYIRIAENTHFCVCVYAFRYYYIYMYILYERHEQCTILNSGRMRVYAI